MVDLESSEEYRNTFLLLPRLNFVLDLSKVCDFSSNLQAMEGCCISEMDQN